MPGSNSSSTACSCGTGGRYPSAKRHGDEAAQPTRDSTGDPPEVSDLPTIESYWDCFAKAAVLSWDEWRVGSQAVCRTGYDGAQALAQAIQRGRATRRLGFLWPADKERL